MAVPHHQAIIMEAESAMAAENVRKNMHIVDIVLSCEEEAIRQVEKLRKLMESGNGLVKTLGMIWNCLNDELSYNSHRRSKDKCTTVNIRWRRPIYSLYRHQLWKKTICRRIVKWRKRQQIVLHFEKRMEIREDNIKRENWPTGRITSVLTGSDRLSRIVQVKTTKGTFIRPMARFYLLEAADTG
ncbi:hypothetical protein T06_14693 [Trichinella sp. T6]|nr:hypothetical protein T06_14693 [Trichinella sp. T6]